MLDPHNMSHLINYWIIQFFMLYVINNMFRYMHEKNRVLGDINMTVIIT